MAWHGMAKTCKGNLHVIISRNLTRFEHEIALLLRGNPLDLLELDQDLGEVLGDFLSFQFFLSNDRRDEGCLGCLP